MSFDPATFQAKVMLKLISTEQIPSSAQNALEAGFDGPRVLGMAILDSNAGWAIDQALPPMLDELGCRSISLDEAALHLARQHAHRVIETDEDPILALPYFYKLMLTGDHASSLIEVGYLDDSFDFATESSIDRRRDLARKAIQRLLTTKSRS